MSTVPFLITDRTLTFHVGSQPYAIDREAAVFPQVVAELNKSSHDVARLIELADQVKVIRAEIERATSNPKVANYLPKGIINVTRDGVTFDGEVIQNALADRLMDILASGLRIGPWVKFAENVYMNPAEYAREELYEWLAKSDLPITDDGCFLAYKRVRSDFRDIHSGTFDNSVGQIVQLANRGEVETDRNRTCARGLHFCSKSYLPHFASSPENKVVLVKVNPADVVSIPSDYGNAKGRTWRYEVVDEVDVAGITDKVWAPISFDYSDVDYDDDFDADEFDDEDYDIEDYEDDEQDEALEALLKEAQYEAEVTDLKALGIVKLRPLARTAGLDSTLAWRVYNVEQLAAYIARKRVYG